MAIAIPWLLFQLAVLLLLASGAAIVIFLLVRGLILGEAVVTDPTSVAGRLGFLVVQLAFWALAVCFWAYLHGFDHLFARRGNSHGSARFSSKAERAAFRQGDGLLIGRDPETGRLLRYDGPAHLLTLAPTRAGKGVGTIIPNLLTVNRPVLVIDPKGENARIAAKARERFGPVHVLDPFGVTGLPSAACNPMAGLDPDDPDLGDEAATLSEALVMDPPGQVHDAHWNEEAKSLLAGLIARAANRFAGKAGREAASVMSNAQRHTRFLDSPRIVAAMARSDVDFADLRRGVTSIFLVLPPNRLDAYSRWLRLMVSQALQDIARAAERPGEAHSTADTPTSAPNGSGGATEGLEAPEAAHEAGEPPEPRMDAARAVPTPALFLLDEFAALGRLEAVERGMGLMAGSGIQLWPILQDLNQLRDLYGTRAGTFLANAAVQQVFGVNDLDTAKWLSESIGKETAYGQSESHQPGEPASLTTAPLARDLLTPDEIMQMPAHLQLLRVQGQPVTLAEKLRYYADPEFRDLFTPQPA